MSRDILDRLGVFGVEDVEFRRLALNMDQIELYDPPPNPTKVSDSRAKGYIGRFGYECWELDALEPSVIGELIRSNVAAYRDDEAYQRVKEREEREKGVLERLSACYDEIERNWEDGLKIEWVG